MSVATLDVGALRHFKPLHRSMLDHHRYLTTHPQPSQHASLPQSAHLLFAAKQAKGLTFTALASHLPGRNEVGTAALFYGQAQATPDDVDALARVLDLPHHELQAALAGFPDRGRAVDPLPPRDPLIYRLFEIVQNYGYAYKAVLNEMLGDGILSAVSFTTRVDRETDEHGADWAVIIMRGKWCVHRHDMSLAPSSA